MEITALCAKTLLGETRPVLTGLTRQSYESGYVDKNSPAEHKIGNNSPKQLAPDLLEMPERKLRKILRKRQVMALLGIGHSALADAVARGDLPKPINITERGRIRRVVRG